MTFAGPVPIPQPGGTAHPSRPARGLRAASLPGDRVQRCRHHRIDPEGIRHADPV